MSCIYGFIPIIHISQGIGKVAITAQTTYSGDLPGTPFLESVMLLYMDSKY